MNDANVAVVFIEPSIIADVAERYHRMIYTGMSRTITLRLSESLIEQVDRERQRNGLSRVQVVQEALQLWMRHRRLQEAIPETRFILTHTLTGFQDPISEPGVES